MNKICNKCNRKLPRNSDYFHNKKDAKDGLATSCKECSKGRFTRFHELKDGEMFCGKCDKILPYNEEYFPIDKSTKDGFRKTCLICSGRKNYGKRRKMPPRKRNENGEYNKKLTLKEVIQECEKIGAICKSQEYVNNKTPMEFECPECNEIFLREFKEVKSNQNPYCGSCGRRIRLGKTLEKRRIKYFEEVKSMCKEIGLKIISTEFVRSSDDLEFECTECKENFLRCWSVLRVSKSTTCATCSRKNSVSPLKYTYEEVKKIFEDKGCKLLSTEYKNNKSKLRYICNCGEEDEKCLSNFLLGQRCSDCATTKIANSNRTPYEEVKRVFESGGCTLLSTEFIHSNIPLDYICVCGNKSRVKLPAFKRGVRCKECAGNEKYSYEEVKEYFDLHECILLSDKYLGTNEKLDYICTCGEEAQTTWYLFRRSPYKKCIDCANRLNGERIRGENHPLWNSDLTEKERIDRRHDRRNKIWRQAVYERDNYTCQCCGLYGTGDLNAHHKDGYNWCKERRYDVTNGITLCLDCHRSFHSEYGYGDNTEEQWNEYYERILSERSVVIDE